MKYIIRSIKYFVYLCLLLTLFIAIIYIVRGGTGSVAEMFNDGYDSLWKMAIVVAAFAALYPTFGYGKRNITAPGTTEEILPKISEFMKSRGYMVVEDKDGEKVVFRKTAISARISKMFEDKVYFTRTADGYEMEGILKEIVRLDSGLLDIFRPVE